MLVEENMLHIIPENISLDCAAIIELLVVVHHAIKQAGKLDLTQLVVLVLGAALSELRW